ncbi:hypothetical protein [Hydrogenophaga sp. ANAO-22]|uniref:hypothetical protein n=1 Tax=Hydrogenophaga sp. ANAO-22 TaxID=3166645 RepID=UPI0036D222B9
MITSGYGTRVTLRPPSGSKPNAASSATVVRNGTTCSSARCAASKLSKADGCSLEPRGSSDAQPAKPAASSGSTSQASTRKGSCAVMA